MAVRRTLRHVDKHLIKQPFSSNSDMERSYDGVLSNIHSSEAILLTPFGRLVGAYLGSPLLFSVGPRWDTASCRGLFQVDALALSVCPKTS